MQAVEAINAINIVQLAKLLIVTLGTLMVFGALSVLLFRMCWAVGGEWSKSHPAQTQQAETRIIDPRSQSAKQREETTLEAAPLVMVGHTDSRKRAVN